MLDGLLPATCHLVADNIRLDTYGERAEAFDLIEYGCDGENRAELRRRHFDTTGGDAFAVQTSEREQAVRDANTRLHGREHCDCVRGVDGPGLGGRIGASLEGYPDRG